MSHFLMARECLGIACFPPLLFLHLLFNLWYIPLYWFLVISFAQPFTSISGKWYYITISVTQQSLPIPALTSSVKWTQVMRVSSLVRCFYQKAPQCHATSIPGEIVLLGKKWVRKSEISRGNVRFKDLYFLFLVFFSEMPFNLVKPMPSPLISLFALCYWTRSGDTLWAQATLRHLYWCSVGRYQP